MKPLCSKAFTGYLRLSITYGYDSGMDIDTLTELFAASIEYTPMKNANKHGNGFSWSVAATFCGAPIEIFGSSNTKKGTAKVVTAFIADEVGDLMTRYQWRDVDGACDLIDQMRAYTAKAGK
jgi:hypothetical protein